MAADNILVLDEGHIVESGKHEQLLERGGLYKTLYDTQFRPNETEPVVPVEIHHRNKKLR